MKTNETTTNILAGAPWLTPWQKRLLVIAGALAGAAIVTLILRWFEARRAARLTAADQGDADQS